MNSPKKRGARRRKASRAGLSVAVLLALGLGTAVARGSEPLEKPRYSPTQRITRDRLAAAQASVEALARQRRELAVPSGWLDLRCSFHAHAEDASHTGGTRPEMLADAVKAGMDVVFLSDHFRPPRDFMASWRFATNGVLFVPGSECRGFLAHPDGSVMAQMEAPIPAFVKTVGAGTGMIFLSHLEERVDHDVEGLTGVEIYNRHYDAKRDMAGLVAMASRVTDPNDLAELQELVRMYPDGVLCGQIQYPQLYLEKWDREGKTHRLAGVGANDCHHNQVFILKKVDDDTARLGTIVDKDEDLRPVSVAVRPGLRRMLEGRKAGEIVARVDLDPYYRAFRCVSTHVLAREKTEPALRAAVRAGHVFVAHEWMGNAKGFRCTLEASGPAGAEPVARMGDAIPFAAGNRIHVESPLPGRIRLLRDGVTVAEAKGSDLDAPVAAAGVHRVEVWLEIGGEWRPWIYGNPIYIRDGGK